MPKTDDQHWMRSAIRLAGEARDRGDEPFGAVLVYNNSAVLEARNAIHTENDLTQHAELRLVSGASRTLDPAVVTESTVYTSTEPCAMCAGAIYWAGVARIVFGLPAASLEAMTGGSGLHQPSRRVLGAASRRIAIDGPLLEPEARRVHASYW